MLNGEEFTWGREAFALSQDMSTKLDFSDEEFTLLGIGHQGGILESIQYLPEGLVMIQQKVFLGFPGGPNDDIVDIGISKVEWSQDVFHDPLKNGVAIFESHDQYSPPHGTPGGAHAGEVPVGFFEGNLVVAILHVEDRPDLEGALTLEDVSNPGKWVGVCDSGVVEAPEVHHKPVFTRLFLGDWKGWTAPGALPRFNFTVLVQLIRELDPGSSAFSHHLVGA